MHATTFAIGELARRSGIPVRLLRHYHARGWLMPYEIDPDTGYRRYSRDDLQRVRLAGALRRSGMPAPEALRAAATDDRARVLEHLESVEAALDTVRTLLPPERPGLVRRLRMPSESPATVAVEPSEALREMGVLRARVAAWLGCPVTELPVDRGRPEGVPDGPSVSLEAEGTSAYLQLPWDGAVLPEGLRRRWVPGAEVLLYPVDATCPPEAAHHALTEEVDRCETVDVFRRLLLSAQGEPRAVLAYLPPPAG